MSELKYDWGAYEEPWMRCNYAIKNSCESMDCPHKVAHKADRDCVCGYSLCIHVSEHPLCEPCRPDAWRINDVYVVTYGYEESLKLGDVVTVTEISETYVELTNLETLESVRIRYDHPEILWKYFWLVPKDTLCWDGEFRSGLPEDYFKKKHFDIKSIGKYKSPYLTIPDRETPASIIDKMSKDMAADIDAKILSSLSYDIEVPISEEDSIIDRIKKLERKVKEMEKIIKTLTADKLPGREIKHHHVIMDLPHMLDTKPKKTIDLKSAMSPDEFLKMLKGVKSEADKLDEEWGKL